MKNVFEQVLQQLHVPYTKKYARNIYLQHPDRNNLWGISDLLALYDISNVSISMSDKEDIDRLSVPFLAEFSQDLVLVTQCNSDFVEIVWKNSLVKIARQQFFRSWTGVVTLLEKTEQSAEPNYVLHLKQQRKEQIESFLFWTFLAIVTVFGFVNKGYAVSPWLIGALLLNVCGAVVCALLTIQHINRGGGVVDKICSVFTKANCHQVLDSRESRVAGYHLSEIGLAFFITNVSAFCILPGVFVSWLPWMVLATFPFTIWSCWTQAVRLKSWCVLCLTVVALLWAQMILWLAYGVYAAFPPIYAIALLPFAYGVFLIFIHRLMPYIAIKRNMTELRYHLNRFKSNQSLFQSILETSPQITIDELLSPLLLAHGKEGFPCITVVSNPYCDPCARMHKRLAALRTMGFGIRYVLTAFDESLLADNERFMAYAVCHDEDDVWALLTKWFDKGRSNATKFWENNQIEVTDSAKKRTLNHLAWCTKHQFYSTPTILVDNHPLPSLYEVEDLLNLYKS